MTSREDVHLLLVADNFTGQRMKRHHLLDLIAKHFNPQRKLFIHRNDFDRIAADSECAALERHIVSLVLDIDKFA